MVDVFDPVSDHGVVYRALIADPRSTVKALAVRTSLDEMVVREVLTDLEASEAAVCVDPAEGRWDAGRPDLVAVAELRRYEDRRVRLHAAEADLMEIYRFARRESGGRTDIEVLDGPEAFFSRFRTIQAGTRSHVRAIDRPPYYWDEAEIRRQEEMQCRQMAAGISYRTIYQESASDSPIRNASMMRSIAAGENACVLADPPIKLTIIDDDLALLPLDPPAGAEGTLVTLLIYRSGLLDALANIFESLWRLAVPVNLSRLNQPLSDRERGILTMMASGATDDAIARRLGLSRRTVVRAVGKLLEHLGATTRYQAGVQAARRGWL